MSTRRMENLSPEMLELMALRLKRKQAADTGIPVQHREGERPAFPLSFAQERVWFLHQYTPDHAGFNVSVAIRIEGALVVEAMQAAIWDLEARHEILRTVYVEHEESIHQVILPSGQVPLTVEHCDALDELALKTKINSEATKAFDLTTGPVMRACLYTLGGRQSALVLVIHHIATDGWSTARLLSDLQWLYALRLSGSVPPPPPRIQYADFAVWQRNQFNLEKQQQALDFWRSTLADAPVLDMPLDHPRPPIQSMAGARLRLYLPLPLTQSLRNLAKQQDASAFHALLALFHALLQRYTGQTDIIIGAPFAGREHSQLEDVVGFFINTLPIRVMAAPDGTFRDLLQAVRESVLDVEQHQQLPFERIVDSLEPNRDPSRTPFYQATLNFKRFRQQPDETSLANDRLKVKPLNVDTATSKYDLLLDMEDTGTEIRGWLEYCTALFEPTKMDAFRHHFERLTRAVCANPDQPLASMQILDSQEVARLLQPLSALPATYTSTGAGESLIHKLFEHTVARFGKRPAIHAETSDHSYEELQQRASQFANYLASRGVEPQERVGLFLPPSFDLIAAMLGILKIGAIYVPLDPSYPKDRLAFIVEDAALVAVLTNHKLANHLPASVVWIADLDHQSTQDQYQPIHISADAIAYVIYTSGSTGRPKGVMVPHRNVARLFSATQHWFGFHEDDVWTLFHSHAFDFSVWEIWGALFFGGKLVIVPYMTRRTIDAFYQLLHEAGITCLSQSPSAFRQLSAHEENLANPLPLDLRCVFFGAEALDPAALKSWGNRHGLNHPQLVNMYGITETCVHVTYRPMEADDLSKKVGSPIGVPIPDLRIHILDRRLSLQPQGVDGEIFVGGPGLAQGYLNQPAITAQRFLPDPFSDIAGERLYKTGDRARLSMNGELAFAGRLDNQVKIRGYRIELGEIQACMLDHPSVAEAVAVTRDDRQSGSYLMAYAVPKRGQSLQQAELKVFVSQFLPEYMVPVGIVILDALPLTEHGKLNHHALPGLEASHALRQAGSAPLETEDEKLLADIWSDVLDLEHVSADDNFFDLGGDSILAVRVVAKAKQRGLTMTLPLLFRYPKLRAAAKALASNTTQPEEQTASPLKPFQLLPQPTPQFDDHIEDAYPMGKLQLGMIFHMELDPDILPYHNVSSWVLQGNMDTALFDAAVQAVVGRHPILRTSLHLTDFNQPLQLVHRKARLPLHVEDLRGKSPAVIDKTCREYVASERQRPFDLRQPPLLRFAIHHLDENLFRFTLTECHAILDGWSLTSALTEIYTHYFDRLAGRDHGLAPPLAAKYADFIRLEQAALSSATYRSFWTSYLSDVTPTRIPRWPQEQASSNSPVEKHAINLEPKTTRDLQQLAQQTQVPLKSILMACHFKIMAFYSGRRDVLIGVQSHGRPEIEGGDQVLGLFLNTLPIRLQMQPGSWQDLVKAVFAAERQVMPYRRFPFSELQEQYGQEPLIGNFFNYLHFHSTKSLFESGGMDMAEQRGESLSLEPNHFPLNLNTHLNPVSETLSISVDSPGHQYHAAQLREILATYGRVLNLMATMPEANHHSCLVDTAARQQLLTTWQGADTALNGLPTLTTILTDCAKHHGERPALTYQGITLSWRELDGWSGRLAAFLAARGIGPEDTVGIAMHRSIELHISLYAILKTGAAYVPLEPDHPQTRLTYMADNAAVSFILTQAEVAAAHQLPAQADILPLDWLKAPAWAQVKGLSPLTRKVQPEQAAYIIYTSGSTGQPKGVVNAHRPVANRLRWMATYLNLDHQDRIIQKTPFGFDVSVWEFFLPAFVGAAVLPCPPDVHKQPEPLLHFIKTHQINTAHFVPSMLAMFLNVAQDTSMLPLTRIICSGEALTANHLRRFRDVFDTSKTQLFNLYGPTEAAIDVTAWNSQDWSPGTPISIGGPIDNVHIHILNHQCQLAPMGTPGELFIGGLAPARGYRSKAGLTASTFIPDPFSNVPGGRLYRSGDIARWLPDGSLDYLGRGDGQVKLRGLRIELGEVEARLRDLPTLQNAVATIWEPLPGETHLIAYVVGSSDVDEAQLRRSLQATLPHYMIPSRIIHLPSLPLNPNGKVDRNALPDPATSSSSRRADHVPPRSPMETTVATAWSKVLRRQDVSVLENLFESGGHSLSVLQIHQYLTQTLQVRFPAVKLYEHPTIESLANYLEAEVQPAPFEAVTTHAPTTVDPAERRETAARRRARLKPSWQDDDDDDWNP